MWRDVEHARMQPGRQVSILLYIGNRPVTTEFTRAPEERTLLYGYLRGPAGTSGGGLTYTQSSPAPTWTINHNLGYRPSVEVLDAGGSEVDAEVQHISLNTTIVSFNVATAGSARLN